MEAAYQSKKRCPTRKTFQTDRFPIVLHRLLQDAETDPTLAAIISWELPHGTSFRIYDNQGIASVVIPRYFKGMQHYKSFRRQLNLYGLKILHGATTGSQVEDKSGMFGAAAEQGFRSLATPRRQRNTALYSHPLLKRGHPDLAVLMRRVVDCAPRPKHKVARRQRLTPTEEECSSNFERRHTSRSDAMSEDLTETRVYSDALETYFPSNRPIADADAFAANECIAVTKSSLLYPNNMLPAVTARQQEASTSRPPKCDGGTGLQLQVDPSCYMSTIKNYPHHHTQEAQYCERPCWEPIPMVASNSLTRLVACTTSSSTGLAAGSPNVVSPFLAPDQTSTPRALQSLKQLNDTSITTSSSSLVSGFRSHDGAMMDDICDEIIKTFVHGLNRE